MMMFFISLRFALSQIYNLFHSSLHDLLINLITYLTDLLRVELSVYSAARCVHVEIQNDK